MLLSWLLCVVYASAYRVPNHYEQLPASGMVIGNAMCRQRQSPHLSHVVVPFVFWRYGFMNVQAFTSLSHGSHEPSRSMAPQLSM